MIILGDKFLYVIWKDNPPSKATNVYKVISDIDYIDGKFVFQIANKSTVSINADQIITIGLSGTSEWGG